MIEERRFSTLRFLVPIFFFIVVYLVLLAKTSGPIWCPDASLHLSQPLRYMQGDYPFVHEWHPSFMFGVIAIPFVWVSKLFTGGTDGLMVVTRQCAGTVWILGVLVIWWRWRRVCEAGALLGCCMFAIWPPWGEGIAYNTFGLLFVTMGIALCATVSRHLISDGVLAGLCYAFAVLCCPHLIALYFLFAVYCILRNRFLLLAVSIGCAIPASMVLMWLLDRISLARIIEMLPYVMNDPEHPPRSIIGLLCDSVGRFLFITHDFAWGHAAIIFLYIVLIGGLVFDCNRAKRSVVYGVGLIALAAVHLGYYCIQPMVTMNVLFIPMAMMAGIAAWLTDDQFVRKVFFWGWLPGALYSVCVGVSSNLGIYSIGFALEATMVPAAIILLRVFRDYRVLRWGFGLYLAFHFAVLYWPSVKFFAHWKEMRADVCMQGPMKGIAKGLNDGQNYDELLNDTLEMRTSGRVTTVAYLDHPNQWLYLASEKRNGALSSWTCGVSAAAIQRLEEYWKINPDKFPDAIFVAGEHAEVGTQLSKAHDMIVETKPSGNLILWKKGIK